MIIFIIYLCSALFGSEFDSQVEEIEFGMSNKLARYNDVLFCASGNGYLGPLYYLEGNKWKIFNDTILLNNSIRDLDVVNDFLIISTDKGIYSLDKNWNINDLNFNLDSEVYNLNSFRILELEQNEDYISINVDANSIYLSKKDTIEWIKIDIPNGYIYDFDFFKDEIIISQDKEGLIKYNLSSKRFEYLIKNSTPIYNINSYDDFIFINTAFENLYSIDGFLWNDFNSDFNLSSNVIQKFYKSGEIMYGFDNSNIYYSSNNGLNWNQKNLRIDLKYDYLVMDYLIEENEIILALNDIGVKKLIDFNFDNDFPNIHNYKVKDIIYENNEIYYLISTIRFEHLIKKTTDNIKILFTISGDVIEDFLVKNEELLVLSRYYGLFYSKNGGELWNEVKLPSDYNFDTKKIELFKDKIYLFNSNLAYESLFSEDFGENWSKVSELNTLKVIDTEIEKDTMFIGTEDKLFSKVNNNLLFLMISESGIEKLYYENGLNIYFNQGRIAKVFYGNTLGFLGGNRNVFYFIDEFTFLFNDMKIKTFQNDTWVELYEFMDLKKNDITSIEKINENNIQIGTSYLGVFNLFYTTTSVSQEIRNTSIELDRGIINSDEIFNMRIIDISGNEILRKNDIKTFNLKELNERIYIAVIENQNKISIIKFINN